MKTKFVFWLWLLCIGGLFSQTDKGARPLATANNQQPIAGVTRAVVVGISDYQSTNIPNLNYADRDAEAFATWLKSPAGGSVPAENILLLIDAGATQGKMGAAFDWLSEETKPGETAILYFSGHGDVEVKSVSQLGFLLCYDAPPASYKAGGAYPLFFLQDVVSTISGKGGKVLLVLDACHAGKLAGSELGGTQATATALARQYTNEVKIMSCQPTELSLEGEEWGGGRGVFSFSLVQGLEGLADKNNDGAISLLEIDHYLGEVVPAETAPHSQIPMTVGERNTVIARVDAGRLAEVKKEQETHRLQSKIGSRNMDIASLLPGDTLTQHLYKKFQIALDSGHLIQPEGQSAWDYYHLLTQNKELQSLHGFMRRNLAAAFQDEVQQTMNALLEADPYEVGQWRSNPSKYTLYPIYLERALALLGEEHVLYKSLSAKKLYFEAYILNHNVDGVNEPNIRDSIKQLAKEKLLQALTYEPDAAYIYHAIGYLYQLQNPYRTDSMMLYCHKAAELAPNWALPYADMSGEWMWAVVNMEESEKHLRKFLAIRPDSYVALERYAITCLQLNRVEEARSTCLRLIDLRPEVSTAYEIMIWAALQKQDYATAMVYAQKMPVDSGNVWTCRQMEIGRVLNRTKRYREGMALIDSSHLYITFSNYPWLERANACFEHGDYPCVRESANFMLTQPNWIGTAAQNNCWLGKAAFRMGEFEAAEKYLAAGIEADPTPNDHDCWLFAYMGLIKEKQGKMEEARQWFERTEGYVYWLSILPVKIDSKFLYGEFLLRQGEPGKALEKFNFILDNCPNDYRSWYGLALYHASRKENTLALDMLEKALERYYPIPGPIYKEPLFNKIRKTKRFKALMAKHFPKTTAQKN